MNQVENALRALRLGPLNWDYGSWVATVSFPGIADPYTEDLIGHLVKQGFVSARYKRTSRRKRIKSGVATLRSAGFARLRQIEIGLHVEIGQVVYTGNGYEKGWRNEEAKRFRRSDSRREREGSV